MTKICFKCKLPKDVSEFYTHKGMTDGHLGKCKECAKQDSINHRCQNLPRIREYDRKRGTTQKRIKENTKRNRVRRLNDPVKYKAQTKLGNAVTSGKIKKPKQCERCGRRGKLHGHHEDYSKPFDVIWLCPICHKTKHIN